MSDEQFLTSPFLPRFHLFSHKLKFFVEGALRALLGPPGPGALAPATPLSRWAWSCVSSAAKTVEKLNFMAFQTLNATRNLGRNLNNGINWTVLVRSRHYSFKRSVIFANKCIG